MKPAFKSFLGITIISTLFLAGCSTVDGWFGQSERGPMPGERISVLQLERSLERDESLIDVAEMAIPKAWSNQFWPQQGGYPNHALQNLSLPTDLKLAWRADIGGSGWGFGFGGGDSKRLPITSQPLVVGEVVYAMDKQARVSAFSTADGKRLWRTDVKKISEDELVIGGGIAYFSDRLFVTNGFNEVLSVDAASGEILWRKEIVSPSRAAPTIMDERIFVSTMDNRLIALQADNGEILWDYSGLSESAGLLGGASPAANRDIVIPVFSSGEVTALRIANGSVAWSDNLSTLRNFGGLSGLSDITGMPIIDKGLVIVMSFNGRMVAIDERNGERVWQRDIGGSETPWVAGNHIFVLTNENELVALQRDSGAIRWVIQLPKYIDEEDKDGPIKWRGPVLAGDRILLAGTSGRVLEIDPVNGKVFKNWETEDTVAASPVVAADTLYLLTERGRLYAYR